MEEEKKKRSVNEFIREVASRAFGYGLAIILASLVLATFPSCEAEPEKIVQIIPGLNTDVVVPPASGDNTEDEPAVTPPAIENPDVDPAPEVVVEYVDIADGYKIDKNGDYSKLLYPEDLEIVNGRILYFRDSAGKSMYIRSSGSTSASSADNPAATFAEDTITLKIRDLTLVFIKK